MFTTLVESRAVTPRHTAGTMTSILMHGALIAVVVALTMPGPGAATETREVEPPTTYVVVRPPETQVAAAPPDAAPTLAPTLAPTTIIVPPTLIPATIEPADIALPAVHEEQLGIRRGNVPGAPGPSGSPLSLSPGSIVDVSDAERIPAVLGSPQAPHYPAALRASGISGRVTARFVIDTLGRVELDGLVITETSHPLFSDAVRSALTRFRFSPGEAAGRKVRTMVQMPFLFALR